MNHHKTVPKTALTIIGGKKCFGRTMNPWLLIKPFMYLGFTDAPSLTARLRRICQPDTVVDVNNAAINNSSLGTQLWSA